MADEVQQTKKASKTGYLDSYIQRIVKEDKVRFDLHSIKSNAVALLNRLSLALIEKMSDSAIKAVLAEGSRTIGVNNLRQIVFILFGSDKAAQLDSVGFETVKSAEDLHDKKGAEGGGKKHKRIAIELGMKIPPVRIAQLVQATAKRIPILSEEGTRKKKKTAEKGKEGAKASKKIRLGKFAPYYFASIVEGVLVDILYAAKNLLADGVVRIRPAEIQMALEQEPALRHLLHTLKIEVIGAGLYDQFSIDTRTMMAAQRGEKAQGESLTKKQKDELEHDQLKIQKVTRKIIDLKHLTMFSQVATITNITKQIVYSLSANVKRISEQFRLALGLYVEKRLFDVAKHAARTTAIRGRATVHAEDLLLPSSFEGYTGKLATLPRSEYVATGSEALYEKYVSQGRVSLRKPQIQNIFRVAGAHRVGADATERLMLFADYLFEHYVTAAFRAAEVIDAKTIGLWALLLQLEVSGVTLVYLLRKDTDARVTRVPTVARRRTAKAAGAAAKPKGRPSGSGKAKTKTSSGSGQTQAAGAKKRGRPPKAAGTAKPASTAAPKAKPGRKAAAKK